MGKGRLEAFSDGVIAVIITIMVLEMKAPHGHEWGDLARLLPVFLNYVLSFVYLGIYWNNHHHLFHAAKHVSAGILWSNLHLLFWLSLIPFVTSWMGENHFATLPVALYGVVLLLCGVAYTILARALVRGHGKDSLLAKAMGEKLTSDGKGLISLFVYTAAIAASYWNTAVSGACYVFVAVMWLIPDRRIEKVLKNMEE